MSPQYLNEKQVAQITGFSLSKLRNDRFMRQGLPYRKIGRVVRYDLDEIHAFMDSHKIDPGAMNQGQHKDGGAAHA